MAELPTDFPEGRAEDVSRAEVTHKKPGKLKREKELKLKKEQLKEELALKMEEELQTNIGIYARCHGQFYTDKILRSPTVINKLSIAAYGHVCYDTHYGEILNPTKIVNQLQHELTGCSQEKYAILHSTKIDTTTGRLREVTETCKLYSGKEWYTKVFAVDTPEEAKQRLPLIPGEFLLISHHNKVINLFHCTEEEYNEYFNSFDIAKQFSGLIQQCSKLLIHERSQHPVRKFVNLKHVFNAVYILSQIKPIKHVNFLDESCNAVLSCDPKPRMVNGKEVVDCYVEPENLPPQNPKYGLGGKRKYTRKRRSRKSI